MATIDEPPVPPQAPRHPIGIGDVLIGLAITVVASAGAAAAFVALDLWDEIIEGLEADQLPSTDQIVIPAEGVLMAFVAGWVGMVGWPVLASYRKGHRSLEIDYGLTRPTAADVRAGLGAGVLALVLNLGAGLVGRIISGGDNGGNTAVLPLNETSGVLLVLLVAGICVGAPIAEELFFRGLALRTISRRWGSGAGVLGSALLFAVVHFGNVSNLVAAAETFVATGAAGLVFARLADRRGSITAGIVSHALVNAVVVTLIVTGID